MITSKTLLAIILTTAFGFIAGSANAAIINITPSKDNTLYEYDPADGDTSNALGLHFFAGETAMSELRRGVLAFDIAGHIPPGSTIIAVTLSLNMSKTPLDDLRTVELHKLLADWGEGTSIAPGEEGDGAPATPNDATWRHRFFDTIFWTNEGGDRRGQCKPVGRPCWTVHVEFGADGCRCAIMAGESGQQLRLARVGDESTILTSKRFDTREAANPPVLTIQYIAGARVLPTPRPRPTPAPRP